MFLARFDFAAEWLAGLWLALTKHEGGAGETAFDEGITPFVMLVTKANNEALAVRRLCELGLGAPARVVLRALVETLFVVILLAARPSVLADFVEAKNLEQTTRFWARHLRMCSLDHYLTQIEIELGPGLAGELSETLREWRKEALQRLSAFVHPTYLASLMNYAPDWARGDLTSGLFGSTSINRIGVLHEAMRWIWYFSLLALGLLFVSHGGRPPICRLKRDSEIDQAVWIGAETLKRLALNHWDDDDEVFGRTDEAE